MAEENNVSIITPERKDLSNDKNGDGNSSSLHNRLKVAPRYLSPSIGSCHDICKYGVKHTFEEKPWKSFQRKQAKQSADGLKTGEGPVLVKKSEVGVNSKGYSVTRSLSEIPRRASLDNGKGLRHRNSTGNPNGTPVLPCLSNSKKTLDSQSTSNCKRYSIAKSFSDMQRRASLDNGKGLRLINSASYRIRSPESPRSSNKRGSKMAVLKKLPPTDPPEMIKSVCFPSEVVEVSTDQVSSSDNCSSKDENPVKSKAGKVKPSHSIDNSDGKGRRRSSDSVAKGSVFPELSAVNTVSKASAKRERGLTMASHTPSLGKSPSFRIRKGGNLRMSSTVKDQNRVHRFKNGTSNLEKASERTLHIIRIEKKKKNKKQERIFESVADNRVTGGFSCGEIKAQDSLKLKTPSLKPNQARTLRKIVVPVSEDSTDAPPVKLKFKSGKVVDPQLDINGPRRLRFRRAKLLTGEGSTNTKLEFRRRTFHGITDAAAGAEISSEKIVLKHQDLQDKKDGQGLFNNVIEETASKLVVTRKSKVKALVGAFETVISLQESKPSQPLSSS